CPGVYNGREGLMTGTETVDFLARFRAGHAVLGASGITAEGPNEVDAEAAAVYRTMAARSDGVILAADHSKFDRPALSLYFPWRHVARLITDFAPQGRLRRALERAHVSVILAPMRPKAFPA